MNLLRIPIISHMKYSVLVLMLCTAVQSALYAQSLVGTVTDRFKDPLAHVHVLNKSTDQHTHTDEVGVYAMDGVSTGDTIIFTHVGYENQVVMVRNVQSPLLVTLEVDIVNLEDIVITSGADALELISDIDIRTNPVNSSQDVLRTVPGLFIGQHAGGGKAEQIFLRGFDIDHGTDINLTVDGLPVNMVSHAHGQGYADLHFVIPETIKEVDFGKGPYRPDQGNFTTAGFVSFKTKNKVNESILKFEAGQFDTYRMMGMFSLLNNQRHNAYVATEHLSTDGPFDSSQNFHRTNVFGKYTGLISNNNKIGLILSHFTSRWDASGQIPQREVDQGSITRFGAIDDTEGGYTERSNLMVQYDKYINDHTSLKNTIFVSQYDFELYSNFTFFLEDPVNGDQIKQKERRLTYGLNSEYHHAFATNTIKGSWNAGAGLRTDRVRDNELSRTLNRSDVLEHLSLGTVYETNLNAYLSADIRLGKWGFNPSARVDYFDFQYNNDLDSLYRTHATSDAFVSPKLNIFYHPSPELQLYMKGGKGFHSNDTRVAVARDGKQTLPAAYGADVGFVWKPSSKVLINMAYWYLFLEQEFVYVGDAGIVEPSGKTRRQGVEFSSRYQPFPWLFWNLDANYTYARSIDDPEDANYIPLAPDFTFVTGLNVIHPAGYYGSIDVRHIADRPANEDNSIVAVGYTVADINVGYQWKHLGLSIQVQNLFDVEWNETQFATQSRLSFEDQPVEEIHFTPGTPFFLKCVVAYRF